MPTAAPTLTRGHKKKERTRRLLLDTARELFATEGDSFSVVDLAARAGVSHGTFYNYFADRDALLDALVPHVVEDFAERMAVQVDEPDPAVRFASISATALATAATAPNAMRMALRMEAVQLALVEDGPLSHMRDDLRAGHAAGRFSAPPDDGTVDVVIGAMLLASRRIVDGEHSADYRRSVVRHLLQSLGIEPHEADAIAAGAVPAA
ncbi:MAG: TetR/AcrR family transcriptional regulator [Ilumatobacteraceae bacterium]